MVDGNVKEEEWRSADLGERVFIDLTVEEEEVMSKLDEVIVVEESMRNQLESESDVSLVLDTSSEDELEISNENDGMNDDSALLINSGERVIGYRTSCENAGGPPDQFQRVPIPYASERRCDWYARICGRP